MFVVFYIVSDTYEPTRKEKQQVQQSYKIKQSRYSLKYRLKTQEDYKTLHKTKEDFASLHSIERIQKTPRTMANCNPVVPVMDWTEDAELHKRYIEWKEEVELELGSSLSNRSNSVKS